MFGVSTYSGLKLSASLFLYFLFERDIKEISKFRENVYQNLITNKQFKQPKMTWLCQMFKTNCFTVKTIFVMCHWHPQISSMYDSWELIAFQFPEFWNNEENTLKTKSFTKKLPGNQIYYKKSYCPIFPSNLEMRNMIKKITW